MLETQCREIPWPYVVGGPHPPLPRFFVSVDSNEFNNSISLSESTLVGFLQVLIVHELRMSSGEWRAAGGGWRKKQIPADRKETALEQNNGSPTKAIDIAGSGRVMGNGSTEKILCKQLILEYYIRMKG